MDMVDWYVFDKYYLLIMNHSEEYCDLVTYWEENGCMKEKPARKLCKEVCQAYIIIKSINA